MAIKIHNKIVNSRRMRLGGVLWSLFDITAARIFSKAILIQMDFVRAQSFSSFLTSDNNQTVIPYSTSL